MDGTITAKGGPSGGNGGFVEASGDVVAINGTADESAPAGHVGTLLLDPTNLDIVAASPGSIDAEFVGNTLLGTAADAVPPPSTISAAKLATLSAGGDVTVQAIGVIDVQSNVSVANGLLLQAGNLLVDRGVTTPEQGTHAGTRCGFRFHQRQGRSVGHDQPRYHRHGCRAPASGGQPDAACRQQHQLE